MKMYEKNRINVYLYLNNEIFIKINNIYILKFLDHIIAYCFRNIGYAVNIGIIMGKN
jgi:hypothetical protein